MKTTKMLRVPQFALLLAGMVIVGGCNNDDEPEPVGAAPVPPAAVVPTAPNSAGASSAAFIAYLKTLGAGNETSEPLVINSDFPSPAEDTEEPTSL